MRDVYAWIDPWQAVEDAAWLKVTKEALEIERKAYAAADAERRKLARRIAAAQALLDNFTVI